METARATRNQWGWTDLVCPGALGYSSERLAVAPAKWKLEFKQERYRRLPLASCSAYGFLDRPTSIAQTTAPKYAGIEGSGIGDDELWMIVNVR